MSATSTPNALARALFAPRSVAIVGASADPAKISGRPIAHLRAHGYEGAIHPVNPSRSTVQDLPAYARVTDIPEPVDVAIVAVPAALVPDAIRSCGEAAIPAAIVFASGFGEIGADGDAIDAELATAIRESGVRVLGPNCIGAVGIASHFTGTFTTAMSQLGELKPGRVAFISQSGAFGTFIFCEGQSAGLGFSHFATTGNEADIHVSELALGVLEEEEVGVLLLYVEGIRDGAALLRVVERARELDKPVVAVKVGRSDAGARAAASHTASLAGADRVYRAVSEQYGLINVDGMEPLLDAGRAFSGGRRMNGNRLTIVTSSGGAGVLMADVATARGLEVAPWSAEWQAKLDGIIPSFGATANPLDVTAAMSTNPEIVSETLRIATEHPETDAIVVVFGITGHLVDELVEAVVRIERSTDKPIFVTWAGGDDRPLRRFAEAGVPAFSDPGRTIAALALLAEWGRVQARPALAATTTDEAPDAAARATARELVERAAARGATQLDEIESRTVLAAYGIDGIAESAAETIDDAVAAAEEIGYPVAVKLLSDLVTHKSELGGVRLDLGDASAVRTAAREIAQASRDAEVREPRFVVQAMAKPGLEMIVGIQRDPTFGPMVLAGFGGVLAELLDDVAMRRVPIDAPQAEAMLDSLRGGRLLSGFRGVSHDRAAVVRALVGLSELADDLGERIGSLDVNPLIVGPESSGAIAVDAVIATREAR